MPWALAAAAWMLGLLLLAAPVLAQGTRAAPVVLSDGDATLQAEPLAEVWIGSPGSSPSATGGYLRATTLTVQRSASSSSNS